MNLIEHGVQISVEITFLMWVFTVTELLLVVYRTTESRTFAGIEIIKDSRIVVRRNGKRFFAIQRRSSSEEVAPCSINISSNGLYWAEKPRWWHRYSSWQQHESKRFHLYRFFNDVCFGCTGSYGSFKRIQVNNNQIYLGISYFQSVEYPVPGHDGKGYLRKSSDVMSSLYHRK